MKSNMGNCEDWELVVTRKQGPDSNLGQEERLKSKRSETTEELPEN